MNYFLIQSLPWNHQLTSLGHEVPDQQAVGKNGDLVWAYKDEKQNKYRYTTASKRQSEINYTAIKTCKLLFLQWHFLKRFGTTIHACIC